MVWAGEHSSVALCKNANECSFSCDMIIACLCLLRMACLELLTYIFIALVATISRRNRQTCTCAIVRESIDCFAVILLVSALHRVGGFFLQKWIIVCWKIVVAISGRLQNSVCVWHIWRDFAPSSIATGYNNDDDLNACEKLQGSAVDWQCPFHVNFENTSKN